MRARVHERRLAGVALAMCTGVMAWLVSRGLKEGTHGHIDFFDFYWAAEAMGREDIYRVGDPGYIYPPLLAFLMQPLTLLSAKAAATAWVFVNAVLAAVLCWLGVDLARRAMGLEWHRERTVLATCATFLFLADSFRNELEWGNCNFIVMLPVLLGIRWLAFPASRPGVAGALLGVAAALKYLPILFLVWLVARRQWRAAGAMLVTLIGLLLAPALQVGWSRNAQFLGSSVAGVSNMLASKVADTSETARDAAANIWPLEAPFSLSIPSGMARIVRDVGLPRWALPVGVLGAAGVCVVACGVVYRRFGYRLFWRHAPTWLILAEGVGVATAMIAFSPQTQKRHFNMVVGLVAWGLVIALAPGKSRASRITAIAGLLLLGALTTPMINTPWTREFMVNTWNWAGGPAWIAVVCQIMIVASTMMIIRAQRRTHADEAGSLSG